MISNSKMQCQDYGLNKYEYISPCSKHLAVSVLHSPRAQQQSPSDSPKPW